MSEPEQNPAELHGLVPTDLFGGFLNSSTPSNPSRMILRISAQGEIRYINTSFAAYLGLTVEELTGQPIEVAKRLCSPQIAACMDMQTASMAAGGLVADSTGRVFEPLVSLDAGILDIILSEISPGGDQGSSIIGIAEMDENERKSVRTLETGDVSILVLRIHSLEALARSQTRHDLRILLDALEETTNQAVTAYSGAVSSAGVGCFLAIFGAPRHFEDHAVRAVVAASELRKQLLRMSASFAEDGKSFAKIGLAVWTGEALTGLLGGQHLGAYSAIGAPVQAALELSSLAGEGEILLGESTLAGLIATPPEGWAFQSLQTESEPELSYLNWSGSTIVPLPEELSCVRCEMVPADSPNGPAHFTFEYLWNLQPAGAEEPSPVVRLLDGEGTSALPLREASAQTQGHTLGRYKLLEVLGAGGMGKVWLAKDRFGYPVAIKVLNTQGTPSAEALKRFRREGEIMAKLRHRSICRIYEMNEVDGVSFIAMEYVNGISLAGLLSSLPKSTSNKRRTKTSALELADLIRSARHRLPAQEELRETAKDAAPAPKAHSRSLLSVEQTLTLFSKVCEAMQFAHEHGVLHRDLKPANILLREDGEPLVADFGLAKLADSQDEASLSMTGNVFGTIQNMAPEQADSSKHVDERADIYSLGTILYHMLTGRPHFKPTGNIIIDCPKLQEHQPVRPRIHNPTIDADLEIIILKCLRPEPSQRYRSVRSLLADITHYRCGEPISARPVSTTELLWKQVLRHKTIFALSAAFLIILGIGTVVAFVQITYRAKAAQAAAAEAEAQREEADAQRQEAEAQRQEAEAQRQLAMINKKDAEEKQALAEQKEREAQASAEEAQASAEVAKRREKEAQVREKEAQEALAALRKAEAETEKQARLRLLAEDEVTKAKQLRLSAEEEAMKAEQLRLAVESQAKAGYALEPKLTLREQYLQYLRKDMPLEEGAKYYRQVVEMMLGDFTRGLSTKKEVPLLVTFNSGNSSRSASFWSLSGEPPSDLISKLRDVEDLLALYALCDPEQGLPLLYYFNLSIFDVGRALSISESMKQRGMALELKVKPDATVGDIRRQLAFLRKKDSPTKDILQIVDQMYKLLRGDRVGSLPAKRFTEEMSNYLSSSDAAMAAALGNWNPDAIVHFFITKKESYDSSMANQFHSSRRVQSITAIGKGVADLAPLFAAPYQGLERLDISYTSVPVFFLSDKTPEELVARHSALTRFDQLEKKERWGQENFFRIEKLDISYSQFASFKQILEFPHLHTLIAVGVPAKDGGVLFSSRKNIEKYKSELKILDISETPVSSFAGISKHKNLQSLRFSPEFLQDKESISELRKMNLKDISTPHDEPNQRAAVFWEKWDRGDYAK